MKAKVRVRIFCSYERLYHRQNRIIRVRIHLINHIDIHSTKHVQAKEVRSIRYHINASDGYCVCPSCNRTFEREYQNYCDRCGQKLAWNCYKKGNLIVIKRIQAFSLRSRKFYDSPLEKMALVPHQTMYANETAGELQEIKL